ncbi:hypothetical protein LTR85_001375 [Meristemomyces frigidus]|nr:hypothetical protein LTR85_001375 [Meristemomyces frigidus]
MAVAEDTCHQPGGETPSPTSTMASSSECSLTNLPAELLHATLVLLPARTLYRTRRISKLFKDYVDDNEEALLKFTTAYNRNRLAKRGKLLSSTTFIEALKCHYAYYGLLGDSAFLLPVYGTFARNCAENGAGIVDRVQGVSFGNMIYRFLARETMADENTAKATASNMMRKMRVALTVGTQCDPVTLAELIEAVDGLSDVQSARYTEKFGEPKHFLTSRRRGAFAVLYNVKGAYDRLPAVLGIPSFVDEEEERKSGDLAYCAKSKAAWCIAADAEKQGLTTLPLFKQAALLEEMFVW